MRILHVAPDLHFARRFVFPIARLQCAQGHVVTIATSNKEYRVGGVFDKYLEGVRFEEVVTKVRGVRDLFRFARLARLIRDLEPELIVCHTSVDSFLPLMVARLRSKSLVIYFNHGASFLGYSGVRRSALSAIERANMRMAHATFTITKAMQQALEGLRPSGRSVRIVGPGSACGLKIGEKDFGRLVECRREARRRLGIGDGERIVLYVGRPVRRKGFFDLLEAWHGLGGRAGLRLLIVGPSSEQVRSIPEGLEGSVSVCGYQENLEPFYLISDVLCVPSHHEGLGYVYLEAAAYGCVPICSDIPGPTDFVKDNVTGFTCKPNDIQSIQSVIAKALASDELRTGAAERAFNRVMAYDREVVADEIARAQLNLTKSPP